MSLCLSFLSTSEYLTLCAVQPLIGAALSQLLALRLLPQVDSGFEQLAGVVQTSILEDVQIDNQQQNLKKYQMYFKRGVIILTLGVYNLNVQKIFECLQTF